VFSLPITDITEVVNAEQFTLI